MLELFDQLLDRDAVPVRPSHPMRGPVRTQPRGKRKPKPAAGQGKKKACSNCQQLGHNKRTCKNPSATVAPDADSEPEPELELEGRERGRRRSPSRRPQRRRRRSPLRGRDPLATRTMSRYVLDLNFLDFTICFQYSVGQWAIFRSI